MGNEAELRLEERDGGWALAGPAASRFGLVDDYLAHLVDRNDLTAEEIADLRKLLDEKEASKP